MSTQIRLPGYGIALNEGAGKDVWLYKAFRNALLDDGYCGPLLTVREYTMMELMNRLTDKKGWETKVFDEEVVAKWKAEALAAPDVDISEKMVNYCIAELRYKSELFRSTYLVEALDGIFKSDTIIPEDLHQSLLKAVVPLESVPEKHKDWHPGSNEQVLDLVHPSLFPLVYGQSRILPDSTVGIQDCITLCGSGDVVPVPPASEIIDVERHRYGLFARDDAGAASWSQKFQWLPSEFELPQGTDQVKIKSYINNLHPRRHRELYNAVCQVVSKVLPLWNATLSPLQTFYRPPPRIEVEGDCYESHLTEPSYRGRSGDWDVYQDQYDAWQASRIIVQPEPQDFKTPEQRMGLDLRKEYGKLQIIVKLANIHLTPEKPRYEGGSWHVEGQMNENICATALYYYDSDNISESLLAFRTQVDNESDLHYGQDDFSAMETIFGFKNEGPRIQEIGKVVTNVLLTVRGRKGTQSLNSLQTGRLLAFPNVFQHCVQPFHLEDPSKPGHRKILALFLVDPHKQIISTANIPCQQKDWWEELVRDIGPLGDLPKELNERIFGMVTDFPISLEKAKEQRLELMEERKRFIVKQTEHLEANTFSLCEH